MLTFNWISDDFCTVDLDGEVICVIDHDRCDRECMKLTINALTKMAYRLKAHVITLGTLGV